MTEKSPEKTADHLSPTQRALLAIQQLQAKLDALEQAQHEPIAIIGMSCRFPGAENPEDFWKLLRSRTDAITPVPDDRWQTDEFYSADPQQPGKLYTREGGFVPHPYDFDAPFFRIAPREAISLDPQQRLLLEVGWEALESAGLPADRLIGTQGGVFVGICSIDYWQQLLSRDRSQIDAYLTTGNTHSTASGRLAYLLGWTGPNLSIDTACASSLTAVHLACQSLRQGECSVALAGGVNRILTPETSINFSKARMLSPDDRCKSFDAAANGFVRAEGCGMIVLKRYRDALADGDRVDAVILGSATNHDGRTSGLTVPSGVAQQAVIRQALVNSRIHTHQISYLEAHGTGTAIGDPIEVNAIGEVFGHNAKQFPPQGDRTTPLWLGSVKTNIGHLEAAAGIAGLIKTVLALQHEEIPPNLHFQTPNPHIDWQHLPVKVPINPVPWQKQEEARIAGISAFGFNGSNAHIVIADPPATQAVLPAPTQSHYLFTLSARTEAALRQLVDRYIVHLHRHPEQSIADICFTAHTGRSHFNQRLAVITTSSSNLQAKLTAWRSGQPVVDLFQGSEVIQETGIQPLAKFARQYVQEEAAQGSYSSKIIDWNYIDSNQRHKTKLPFYPFQRQRYQC